MKKSFALLAALMLVLAVLALPLTTAQGTRSPQLTFQTPTPGADGKILYTVKAGESCTSVSLLSGTSVDELRRLNNLGPDCSLTADQPIVLGIVTPVVIEVTAGPSPTPTALLPTPTIFPGSAKVCVVLYADVNGDAFRQDTEAAMDGGAVSLTDRSGGVSLTGTTITQPTPEDDPMCFTEVPEGEYNVSVAIPDGFNPTTVMNYPLTVKPGDLWTLDFGAQVSSAAAVPTVSEGGRNPTLGILGALLLIGGAGLGVYIWRSNK
jgi:hypothetical protein